MLCGFTDSAVDEAFKSSGIARVTDWSCRMTIARTWLCGTLSTASQGPGQGAVRLALLQRAACWR